MPSKYEGKKAALLDRLQVLYADAKRVDGKIATTKEQLAGVEAKIAAEGAEK